MNEPMFILEIKLRTSNLDAIEYMLKYLWDIVDHEQHLELSIVKRVVER